MSAPRNAGMVRGPRSGEKRAPSRADAELAFMLARHAVTRWQFDAQRLQRLANDSLSRNRSLALMETELGLSQIEALSARIRPFTRSRDLAVRFEAQEMLVAFGAVEARIARIHRDLRPEGAQRSAGEIQAALLARLRS